MGFHYFGNGRLAGSRRGDEQAGGELDPDVADQPGGPAHQGKGARKTAYCIGIGITYGRERTTINEMIRQGGSISIEFKSCRNQLGRGIYETVCAFLNRYGGTILVGVIDSGEVQGIYPGAINRIKKDFVNSTCEATLFDGRRVNRGSIMAFPNRQQRGAR